jgi:hypothetical protein
MYKTKEQQIVVESRIKSGYESQELPNGDWMIWKGRHKMIINCLGYDIYVPSGNLK